MGEPIGFRRRDIPLGAVPIKETPVVAPGEVVIFTADKATTVRFVELEQRIKTLKAGLKEVINTLGPEAPDHDGMCEGCHVEIQEALRAAKEALFG